MNTKIKILVLLILFASPFFAQGKSVNITKVKSHSNMVLIPAGDFVMGTDSLEITDLIKLGEKVPHMDLVHAYDWFSNEFPKRKVSVKAFYMDKYEVTNKQFSNFIKATGYKAEGDWQKYATKGRENHPVVNVTWNDAKAYAKWAGKRLPTETEWEYAARGGSNFRWFWWGNEASCQNANFNCKGENIVEGLKKVAGLREVNTKPVGSYKPNGFGLFDMLGNVSEWCENDFNGKDESKSVRGGSWASPNQVFIRIQYRRGFSPEKSNSFTGFRCVKDVK